MQLPIPDRRAAGQALAEALQGYRGRKDLIVLALPRGGVPVAAEIADALQAPLDLMLVRKLGVPGYPELAMGAIASGGVQVMNDSVLRGSGIGPEAIQAVVEAERRELVRRERAYRGDRPWPKLEGRCVILVDDGLATGATMRAAVDAVHVQRPARIVVAVPVAPPDTVRMLQRKVDEVVCLFQPEPFMAIGQWYVDFSQVSDSEVEALLAERWGSRASAPGEGAE
ncbi:phosphoribosyltransferase [Thiohalobacter sp. IOR34]|uniref:phosphoribosyltransferase n=1 Tax=Thiohalobacter sp. IOR34 TaxID=3057176 RepID=UPI0025B252A9|nr:phosphoribosyltransferase [Thiohalobacter sp. IOR34]WJW76565.1 phosphoribosyltransferase [Thiohalobacter sp. IOR34]